MNKEILMVGYGAMGSALGEIWKQHHAVTIVDPSYANGFKQPQDLPADYNPDIIVFAVKPQLLSTVLPFYKNRFQQSSTVWVSIAAGAPLKFFKNFLPDSPIVRAMPNLGVRFQQGMTALYAESGPIQSIEELFQLTGKTLWFDQENQMDAVTAVAGSGPAYYYAMIEALALAGESLGLESDKSMILARQTAIGASFMLQNLSDSVSELRQQVTSPNGTTAAALEILMDATHGLPDLMQQTVKNAYQRAIELGKEQLKLTNS